MLNQLTIRAGLESANEELKDAAAHFNSIQPKVNKDLVASLEKIALYSAGIVSLSLTFVGSISDGGIDVLNRMLLHQPIKYFLFLSWTFLLAAFICGLFYRWFNARSLYWIAAADWIKKRFSSMNVQRQAIIKGFPIIFTDGTEKDVYIKEIQERVEEDKKLCENFNKKYSSSEMIKSFLQFICFVSFIFGILILSASMMAIVFNLSIEAGPDKIF